MADIKNLKPPMYAVDPEDPDQTPIETTPEQFNEETAAGANLVQLDPEKAARYAAKQEGLHERIERESSLGETVKAAGLGGAAGLSLGIAPWLARVTGLLPQERQQQLRDEHPWAYKSHEIGGMIAPVLLTGGAGGAAEAGVEGASVAGGALRAAAELAPTALAARGAAAVRAGALGTMGGEEAGLAARAAASALAGGAEMLPYAAGGALSEETVENPEMSAASVWDRFLGEAPSSLLLGGALGGGLEAAGSIIPEVTGKLSIKTGKAIGTVDKWAAVKRGWKPDVVDALERNSETTAKLAAHPGGEDLLHSLKDAPAEHVEHVLDTFQNSVLHTRSDLQAEAKRLTGEMSGAFDEAEGAIKKSYKKLGEWQRDTAQEYVSSDIARGVDLWKAHTDLMESGQKRLAAMAADPTSYDATLVKRMQRELDDSASRVAKISSGPDAYGKLWDEVGQLEDSISKTPNLWEKNQLGMSLDFKQAADQVRAFRGDVDAFTKNKKIWGEAAEAQAEKDAATSARIGAEKDARLLWNADDVVNGTKIEQIIRDPTNAGSERMFGLIQKYHEALGDSVAAVTRRLPEAAGELPRLQASLKDSLEGLSRTRKTALEGAQLREQLSAYAKAMADIKAGGLHLPQVEDRRILEQLRKGPGVDLAETAAIGGTALEAAHKLASGADLLAATPGLGMLFAGIKLGVRGLEKVGEIVRETGRVPGQSKFLNGLRTSIFRTLRTIDTSARALARNQPLAVATVAGLASTDRGLYKRRAADVARHASNPDSLVSGMADGHGHLAAALPSTALALSAKTARAYGFLAGVLPVTTQPGPLAKPIEPSDPEIRQFNRLYSLIAKPTRVLDLARTGQLTDRDVTAVEAVHPEALAVMRQQVLGELAKAKAAGRELPYQKRLALGTLLGQDLDGSLKHVRAPGLGSPQPTPTRKPASRPAQIGKGTLPKRTAIDRGVNE